MEDNFRLVPLHSLGIHQPLIPLNSRLLEESVAVIVLHRKVVGVPDWLSVGDILVNVSKQAHRVAEWDQLLFHPVPYELKQLAAVVLIKCFGNAIQINRN